MRRAGGFGVLALLVGAGTACERGSIALSWPAPEGASSRVLAIEHEGTIDLSAASALDLGTLGVGPYGGGSVLVTILYYDESLEELELAPGPMELAAAGAPSRLLPQHARAYEARIEDGDTVGFERVTTLAPHLQDIRMPRRAAPPSCPRLAGEPVLLDSPAPLEILFIVPESKGKVLVGTRDGDVRRITRLGKRIERVLSSTAGVSAGFRAPDGVIWLGTRGGRVGRLVEDRLELEPGLEAGDSIAWLTGPATSSVAFELFAITARGRLLRHRPDDRRGAFEELWVDPLTNSYARWAEWLGPGELGFVDGEAQLWRRREGLGVEPDPPSTLRGFEVRHVRRNGLDWDLAAVYRRDAHFAVLFDRAQGGAWTEMTRVDAMVYALAPLAGGFVFSGSQGIVGYVGADRKLCRLENVGEGRFYSLAVSASDEIVAAGLPRESSTEATPIYFVDLLSP